MSVDDEASKRGRMARNKGKRGERGVVEWLKKMGFPNCRRTAQRRGDGVGDVECDELPYLHIEVKLWATFNPGKLREACFQALRDKPKGHECIVIWRCTDDKQAKRWRMCYLKSKYGGARVIGVPPDLDKCKNKLIQLNTRAAKRHVDK